MPFCRFYSYLPFYTLNYLNINFVLLLLLFKLLSNIFCCYTNRGMLLWGNIEAFWYIDPTLKIHFIAVQNFVLFKFGTWRSVRSRKYFAPNPTFFHLSAGTRWFLKPVKRPLGSHFKEWIVIAKSCSVTQRHFASQSEFIYKLGG